MSRMIVALVLTVALAVLASCTDDGEDDDTAPTRDRTQAKTAWTNDLDVIGQPAVEDATAVVLVRARDDELDIVGVDTSTGQTRWTHPYSPGPVPPGLVLLPRIVADDSGTRFVSHLEPADPLTTDNPGYWLNPLVIRDLESGEEVDRTEPLFTSSPVVECADETDACVRAGFGEVQRNLRFDLDSGELAPDDEGQPDGQREIADGGLFSTNDRPGERLGVRRDGSDVWSKAAAAIFGEGYSTDHGWGFVFQPEAGRYLGYIGDELAPDQLERAAADAPFERDLAKRKLVGLDARTGEVDWTKEAARFCLVSYEGEVDFGTSSLPVRCVFSGTARFEGDETTALDVRIVVEGYDAADGMAVWRKEMSAEAVRVYVEESRVPLTVDPSTVVVTTADGPELVSTLDGSTLGLRDDDVFACLGRVVKVEYVLPVTYGDPRRTENTRSGGSLNYACAPDGSPVKADFTVDAVKSGAEPAAGDNWVMSTDAGLVGYKLGD